MLPRASVCAQRINEVLETPLSLKDGAGAEQSAEQKGTIEFRNVSFRYPGSEDLIVRMDEYSSTQKMCAIALLENETGDSFSVSKQVKYFSGHPPMDEAFHWGLRWVAGRK